MSISINIRILNHWVQIGIYPFSWLVFVQYGEGHTNFGFGPLRLTFN